MASTPLVIVVAGPARGRSAPLEGRLAIGRDEQNTLPIGDPALSRHHCTIEVTGSQFLLKDLASKNGVFVNGLPVTERLLSDGDQIRIGDSALVVTIPSQQTAASDPGDAVTVDDTPVPAISTIAIDATKTGSEQREHILFRLSEALQQAENAASLHEVLLTFAMKASTANSAAILALSPGADALEVIAAKTPGHDSSPVNRSVAMRALTERVAVLANDIHSLCVPLLGAVTVPSVLCLTHLPGQKPFTEDHLQIVAAIGSLGGLALERIRHIEWLRGENVRLRHDAAIDHDLVGESAAMQGVYRFIARAAPSDATVLLRGESGTGKELVARAIHANSARGQGPFIPINCAALPEGLLESELFGHERGAFTGAIGQQRGRLELADRGTVFLDEVGELAPSLQAKLLRVLEDQVVERIGARRGIKIDVRVIAATNRDLEAALEDGTFRRDLYYRLNVVSLTVPPLRERQGDLPLLSAYFVRKHAARCKRGIKGISPVARSLLAAYDWPGNVRELSNAIERAVVLGSTDVILPEDLPETLLDTPMESASAHDFHSRVAASKREIIREALEESGGNVAKAARTLGLQPTYLHRLIKNLAVRSSDQQSSTRNR